MFSSLIQEAQSSLLNIVGQLIEALPGIMMGLVILCLTRYAAQTLRSLIDRFSQRVIKNASLRALMQQVGYAGTWIIGIVTACVTAFPDLGLGDIIALLGLGSVAIGFAFQDIVKNFLAGILLLLQEPFRLGDQIVVQDYEGTVKSISLRSTEILTYQGERVLLPNAVVFTSPVHVMTAEEYRRTDLEIGVDYNTPLPVAAKVLLEAVQAVAGVESTPKPEVDVAGFGDSSLDMVVRYWTTPYQGDVRRIRSKVMMALKEACDRADINIPYPIRTVYFYNQETFDEGRRPVEDESQPQQEQPQSYFVGSDRTSKNSGHRNGNGRSGHSQYASVSSDNN